MSIKLFYYFKNMEEPEIIYESTFIPKESINKSIDLLNKLPFTSSRHVIAFLQ